MNLVQYSFTGFTDYRCYLFCTEIYHTQTSTHIQQKNICSGIILQYTGHLKTTHKENTSIPTSNTQKQPRVISFLPYTTCTMSQILALHNTWQSEPFSDGGANKTSFTASKNRSRASHVLLLIAVDFSATVWIVRRTRWQWTACLLTRSAATATFSWSNVS